MPKGLPWQQAKIYGYLFGLALADLIVDAKRNNH
jgi:hypothetical protein